ncbi:hypothetical protein [Francisella-like endosymbiont]
MDWKLTGLETYTGNAEHNVGKGDFSIHKSILSMFIEELKPFKI